MKSWTEFHISIVYFSGIFIAFLTSVGIVLYFLPAKSVIKKMSGRFDMVASRSFQSTILMAGLLGAMSISFRACNGSYEYLRKSPIQTINKGLEQVSTSFHYLMLILAMWFVIFIAMQLVRKK